MRPSQRINATRNVERALHRTSESLKGLIAQTPEEVEETQQLLGSTPCERPESLQTADAVLDRIIQRQREDSEPTAFGKTVTLMRTERKLTIDQLAEHADLDVADITEIETNHDLEPDPMMVVVLAEFFRVPVAKMQRLAGLTQHSDLSEEFGSLHLAAGARPEFDQHSREEKKDLLRWLKQFRRQR